MGAQDFPANDVVTVLGRVVINSRSPTWLLPLEPWREKVRLSSPRFTGLGVFVARINGRKRGFPPSVENIMQGVYSKKKILQIPFSCRRCEFPLFAS